MKSNLVHTYIGGNSFSNIFGGETDCFFGYIVKLDYLDPWMERYHPYLKGKWCLSDHKTTHGHFDTLKQAKEQAREIWPRCWFKTRKEYAREYHRE